MGKNGKEFGKGDFKAFFRLIPYVKLPWVLLIVALVLNLAESELMTLVPVSNAALMAGEFTSSALKEAILYNFLSFALVIVVSLALTIATSVAVKTAQKIMWNTMLHLKMEYYDRNNPNDLLSIITNDTEVAMEAICSLIVTIIPTLYYVFRVFATLKSYDYRLLLSVFILVPLNVIYVVVLGRWKYEVNKNIFEKIGDLTGYLAERVANITLIRTYTNEQYEIHNGMLVSKGLYDANMKNAKVTLISDCVAQGIDVLQRCMPIVVGALLLKAGAISLKQWMVFYFFVSKLISEINNLLGIWTSIKTTQGSASRMVDLFEQEQLPEDSGKESEISIGDLVFDDVEFRYGDTVALKDIDVTIPCGKTTAIVGKCGSGKTTLLSLIERLYEPDKGTITMNGRKINEYNLESYREVFAYVQQNAGLFSGSLKETLTYGASAKISDEDILDAVRKTGIDRLVEQFGLELPVRIGASSISGGQRQRIVLTRELLKNRDMILLDEPTSALDAKSAYDIQKLLFTLFKGKTLVMVTHDVNLLSGVDNIILMNDGEIVATGSHKQLSETCEAYQDLLSANEQPEVAL